MKATLKKLCLLLVTVSLLGACASKERFNTAKAINEECQVEMQAARTAVRLRDKGKTKADMQAQLPPIEPDSSRLLINLYEIVTETYQFNSLNEVVYPTYRFELCMRQLQGKAYPASLALIEQPLLDCQDQYALQSSAQSTACILQAMDQFTPQQPHHPAAQSETLESSNETQP
jgi:hypothetical protein